MPKFNHLHVHTQYSLLDGASDIKTMLAKAQADGMEAVAITDHGNMFGVFDFVMQANKFNIKPIVGCEFYVVDDRNKKQFTKENHDVRYHQLMLAKDQSGYHNLVKLCSLGYTEGLYSKWPRIDKELIEKYHEGLIATTCCIGAEVPQAILNKSEEEAEKLFQWWLDLFGDDYYIELQRHGLDEQKKINSVLLKWSKKYNVKVIATNDSHYIDQKDSDPHDILLCINTGDVRSTPVGDGKGFRFGFPNDNFYFKTQAEMNELFSDVPEAIDNTNEIVGKITSPKLKRDMLLPHFPIPDGFANANEYLNHLAYEGAVKRYKILTPEIEARLNYELDVIEKMGFAGYFLIVSDFIKAGQDMGVLVGPGRGSAAGSVVAYCIQITNIDPIAYNLLFERFLNPERVSMPDIDTDFDDAGRQKVIDYVVKKYGKNQVAQIVTYGTMATKMSIKDVARALELPLPEADALTKMVPTAPEMTFKRAYELNPDLKKVRDGNDMRANILKVAERLEGNVRNTGVHAAGVIIAPGDLTDLIPMCITKDAELMVTQFEGKVIEDTGLLKMDFLGLRTLSIIKDTLTLIKRNYQIDLDLDNIPIDDTMTYEIFQRGETVGIFQFEAGHLPSMLREMKPTDIEDLIAMNALNRPGPMEFIPMYIRRKHCLEKVQYPHPLLEPILKTTHGILVYQEQIMEAAKVLAGYSLGGADLLRRAMGKKDKEKMAKERDHFVKGCKETNQIPGDKANEIFDLMERFANYGFNRSHAAAYSIIAYQTAYLKAHYAPEFMSAILTNHLKSIEDLSFFMDECRRMGIKVLGPDVNESEFQFASNKNNQIRFGLGGIKGMGESAALAIIEERKNGKFKNIFDLAKRITARSLNKKSLEVLIQSGALDSFGEAHRAQYFANAGDNMNVMEKAMRIGNAAMNAKSTAHTLFGEMTDSLDTQFKMPHADPWSLLEQLHKEKEVAGIYLSGHPLDDYKLEIKNFCNTTLSELESCKGREVCVAGVINDVTHKLTKKGQPFANFTLEDYSGSTQLALFSEDYLKFKHFLVPGQMLFVKGRYQPRYNSQDIFELKILQVTQLQEVREKLAKKVEVQLELDSLDDDFVQKIELICKKYPGTVPLSFRVTDVMDNIYLQLFSTKNKVNLSNDWVNEIETLPGVELKVN
jgi:DNA polymerase III subunit alpha